MSIGSEASIQSLEVENFAKAIPSVIAKSGTLYAEFEKLNKQDISHVTQAGSDTRPAWQIGRAHV